MVIKNGDDKVRKLLMKRRKYHDELDEFNFLNYEENIKEAFESVIENFIGNKENIELVIEKKRIEIRHFKNEKYCFGAFGISSFYVRTEESNINGEILRRDWNKYPRVKLDFEARVYEAWELIKSGKVYQKILIGLLDFITRAEQVNYIDKTLLNVSI